jgi:hypothetical protein
MDLAKDKIMESDCRTVTVKSDFYRECGTFNKCFHKKIAALITAVNERVPKGDARPGLPTNEVHRTDRRKPS